MKIEIFSYEICCSAKTITKKKLLSISRSNIKIRRFYNKIFINFNKNCYFSILNTLYRQNSNENYKRNVFEHKPVDLRHFCTEKSILMKISIFWHVFPILTKPIWNDNSASFQLKYVDVVRFCRVKSILMKISTFCHKNHCFVKEKWKQFTTLILNKTSLPTSFLHRKVYFDENFSFPTRLCYFEKTDTFCYFDITDMKGQFCTFPVKIYRCWTILYRNVDFV